MAKNTSLLIIFLLPQSLKNRVMFPGELGWPCHVGGDIWFILWPWPDGLRRFLPLGSMSSTMRWVTTESLLSSWSTTWVHSWSLWQRNTCPSVSSLWDCTGPLERCSPQVRTVFFSVLLIGISSVLGMIRNLQVLGIVYFYCTMSLFSNQGQENSDLWGWF